jgi:hypothetical protein
MSIVNKLRIAVYGWLVIGALLVWHLRPDEAEPTTPAADRRAATERPAAPPGYELRGEANGYRVTAFAQAGAIRRLVMVVPAPCARSPWQEMQATLDGRQGYFVQEGTERYGARFRAKQTAALEPDRTGSFPRLAIEASGEFSADGRRAHGTTVVRVQWVRNGVERDSCESRPTRWSVRRP